MTEALTHVADADTQLIDLETGHRAALGSGICAACWYPARDNVPGRHN